jgi:5'-methylthioadenosine phosphorylase
MEGPAFSTKAESEVYRSWGMAVIGMTNLPEAKLAREAEICYATMALVTDYDCWHPGHDSVTVEMVIEYLHRNSSNAQKLISGAVSALVDRERTCKCAQSLRHAIITPPDKIQPDVRERLAAIIGKYFQD